MTKLFDVSTDNIGLHIKNILKDNELDKTTTEESSVVQLEGNGKVRRKVLFYNLDMIISVGYRVKSENSIILRKWASNILKQYLTEGYATNSNRLTALNKTLKITTIILSYALNIEENELLNVLNHYLQITNSLQAK